MLLILVAVAMALLIYSGALGKNKLDERITLRRKDKIPYGTWVAFHSIPKLFPAASVYTSRKAPGNWDSVHIADQRQVFISVNHQFQADESEMKELLRFVSNGNYAFISTFSIPWDVEDMLNVNTERLTRNQNFDRNPFQNRNEDSLLLQLPAPPYAQVKKYGYPGKGTSSFFNQRDDRFTDLLSTGPNDLPIALHWRSGKGHLFVHLAPLSFSNYFLLHKNNLQYLADVWSVIPQDVTKIVWDEYYLLKKEDRHEKKKKSWFRVLIQYPAFKAALLTALAVLLLYVLMEMRRKQRYIPVHQAPRNDSLDFVKTIGRLYYERGDHKNLCRKMAAYFLEHVRSRYKLSTGILDEEFILTLQVKTAVLENEIRGIVSFIAQLEQMEKVNPEEMGRFFQQLEYFYRNG